MTEHPEKSKSRAWVNIRRENATDVEHIRELNKLAFGRDAEAELVDALRGSGKIALSLIALEDKKPVGHLLMTQVGVEGGASAPRLWGLGPVAVLPARQKHGIGSKLIGAALFESQRAGCEGIVTLGDPAYYSRFGFGPASRYGLRCEFDAPEGAFMLLEFFDGALRGRGGLVRYASEFSSGRL